MAGSNSASLHGLLVLDKVAGVTSRDAVNCIQRLLPRGTRIGHTGTLDPLATGVLVLCIGSATRLAEYVQRMPKTYHAGIVLGARSDTDDADGAITPVPIATPPTWADITTHVHALIGTIDQVPPAYSAAKVTGRRAYAMARRGETVNLDARPVTIYGIDVLSYAFPRLELVVCCGKGTYIRSLARDLGERLGCGGYIKSLRRTRVGCFDVAAALPYDVDAPSVRGGLLPLTLAVAELPRRMLTPDESMRVRRGQPVAIANTDASGREVALFNAGGELVGVGTVDAVARVVRPGRVLTSEPPASAGGGQSE
jgi:tRNA pseudouridine55 synthase